MSYETESYADRWVRRYKGHQVATVQEQSVSSLLALGSVVATTALQSGNSNIMCPDVPVVNPDIHPVVLLAIELSNGLGLTQAAFARRLNISVRTYRDWIGGRRQPSGPAITLLLLIVEHPEYITDMDKPI